MALFSRLNYGLTPIDPLMRTFIVHFTGETICPEKPFSNYNLFFKLSLSMKMTLITFGYFEIRSYYTISPAFM